jgi:hypothetical protein
MQRSVSSIIINNSIYIISSHKPYPKHVLLLMYYSYVTLHISNQTYVVCLCLGPGDCGV